MTMCGAVKGVCIKQPMLPEAERDIGDAGEGSEMEALSLLWGWTPSSMGHRAEAMLQPQLHFPARQR